MAASRARLPPGTRVGSYRIIRDFAAGGFSLIYLARDLATDAEVLLKEYMPKTVARRDARHRVCPMTPDQALPLVQGRTLFFREIQTLALLRHPNLVRVLAFFQANDTGYLAMPHEPGRNLAAWLEERRGSLSTAFLLEVFVPILDALALLHQRSMQHLDVKPDNIHLRHGNRPLLLDLGAARGPRSIQPGGQIITAGYAPLEQYSRTGSRLGSWTDVYAVGASLFCCMTGRPPPPAPERQRDDAGLEPQLKGLRSRYPDVLVDTVAQALAMDPVRRPRDAGALLVALLPLIPNRETNREPSHASVPPSS